MNKTKRYVSLHTLKVMINKDHDADILFVSMFFFSCDKYLKVLCKLKCRVCKLFCLLTSYHYYCLFNSLCEKKQQVKKLFVYSYIRNNTDKIS